MDVMVPRSPLSIFSVIIASSVGSIAPIARPIRLVKSSNTRTLFQKTNKGINNPISNNPIINIIRIMIKSPFMFLPAINEAIHKTRSGIANIIPFFTPSIPCCFSNMSDKKINSK